MIDKNFNKKIKNFLSGFIFILILSNAFISVSYLFRNSGTNRMHIVGIKEEEALDMVYIGGSAAFVFWQPLRAWNDCGFTSYNYATDTIQAECIKYYVREVRKYQNPELFVIDIRPFQYWEKPVRENGIRNGPDSMDYSVNRVLLLQSYLEKHTLNEGTDQLSYYIDIAKYHTNLEALGNAANWQLINNTGISINKGMEWKSEHKYLDAPMNFITDNRTPLVQESSETLIDLLNYCTENDLNVLFIVSPYKITRGHQEMYNTMMDMIESYGFHYLNTNEYYNEMNIDFSQDYYDESHVNALGAEKYTIFLEKYLVEQFDLPDHREDASYQSWDNDFDRFCQEEEENKKSIYKLILQCKNEQKYEENK